MGKGSGVGLELLEELAEAVVDHVRMHDLFERRELRGARRRSSGGMNTVMSHTSTASVRRRSVSLPSRSLSSERAASTGATLPERITGRSRGYTRPVADESAELFDDIYLGLRAGGAARKQRRGEPCRPTRRRRSAAGIVSRSWRKFIAIGAFALGTFGLGFTVGGLVFGRWRKPELRLRRKA